MPKDPTEKVSEERPDNPPNLKISAEKMESSEDDLSCNSPKERELEALRARANQGEPEAQTSLAGLLNDLGEHAEAAHWYHQAAKRGYAKAQVLLGRLAERGDPDAQCSLGGLHFDGPKPLRDFEKALFWFQKAAEQGHASAQNLIGVMYSHGLGISHDSKEAMLWFRGAGAQGDRYAQYNMGNSYLYGKGVLPDHSEALQWYKKSATQGHRKAQEAVTHIEATEEDFKRFAMTDVTKQTRVAKQLLRIPRVTADTPDLWGWIVRDKRPSKKDANKFLLACAIDYQMEAERVWKTARQFTEGKLGDPEHLWEYITSFTESQWQAKKQEFSLHRFLAAHMRVWHIGRDVVSQYGGDSREIWEGQSPDVVYQRLQKLGKGGIGANISNMVVGALIDTHQIVGTGDVKADTHVRRILGRVFHGHEFKAKDSSKALEEARKMYPCNPWLLDQPLYFLGGETCKQTEPDCASCLLRLECLYLKENECDDSCACKGE